MIFRRTDHRGAVLGYIWYNGEMDELTRNIQRLKTERSKAQARAIRLAEAAARCALTRGATDEDTEENFELVLAGTDNCQAELAHLISWLNEEIEKITWGLDQLDRLDEAGQAALRGYMSRDVALSVKNMWTSNETYDDIIIKLKELAVARKDAEDSANW